MCAEVDSRFSKCGGSWIPLKNSLMDRSTLFSSFEYARQVDLLDFGDGHLQAGHDQLCAEAWEGMMG
jgi:hypothetical protein